MRPAWFSAFARVGLLLSLVAACPGAGKLSAQEAADQDAYFARLAQCDVTLSGRLNTETATRASAEITAAMTTDGSGGDITLCLDSPGGFVSAAKALVPLFDPEQYDTGSAIHTVVRSGSECLSACALVFMLGFECQQFYCFVSRFVEPGARLGFHAPFLPSDFPHADDRALAVAYSAALGDFSTFVSAGNDPNFIDNSHRYPTHLIARILNTGPNEFFEIDTLFRALSNKIDILGPLEIYAGKDWLINICGNKYIYHSSSPETIEQTIVTVEEFPKSTNPDEQFGLASIELSSHDDFPDQAAIVLRFGYAINAWNGCVFAEDAGDGRYLPPQALGLGYVPAVTGITATVGETIPPEGGDLSYLTLEELSSRLAGIQTRYNSWMFQPPTTRLADMAR